MKQCPRKECNNEAIISKRYGILPCEKCQKRDEFGTPRRVTSRETMPTSKLHRIQKERDHGGKDMLQPFIGNKPNPDFAKAYPNQVGDYFTKSELKNL